jgi:HBS1 N-terminus
LSELNTEEFTTVEARLWISKNQFEQAFSSSVPPPPRFASTREEIMSKHRIKSVALDDDYDDYDEEEYDQGDLAGDGEDGLTAEDKEQLQIGTVQVRSALGLSSATITDKEIQDTLWHYYYDVAKSVAYLKSMYNSPGKSKLGCLIMFMLDKPPTSQKKVEKTKLDRGSQQPPGESQAFLNV